MEGARRMVCSYHATMLPRSPQLGQMLKCFVSWQNGAWDDVSGETFLRTLLSMPVQGAKFKTVRPPARCLTLISPCSWPPHVPVWHHQPRSTTARAAGSYTHTTATKITCLCMCRHSHKINRHSPAAVCVVAGARQHVRQRSRDGRRPAQHRAAHHGGAYCSRCWH